MSDFVLIDGDMAVFQPNFGAAVVVPQPGKIKGSGPATQGGKKICIAGDEKSVAVQGCMYMTPQYSIPGSGTLKIDALAGNQQAGKSQTGGKAMLLKGGGFTAKFEVQSPAQQPTPSGPVPDATPVYSGGTGTFIATNTKFRAT